MLQTFFSKLDQLNHAVSQFVWGAPAMVLILGVGLYLSVRTGFLQVRRIGYAMKVTAGRMFQPRLAKEGTITPIQAVCTALASTIGTGNLVGIAGAISIGGPGAVFWMWVSAFLGMCTKYAEVTLAVHFRQRNEEKEYVGGPMYFIRNGLPQHWHWLAGVFSVCGVLAVFGTGNATQVNAIVSAVDTIFLWAGLGKTGTHTVRHLFLGVLITALVLIIMLGGAKRIGRVSELLVPFMAGGYLVLCLGVVFWNFHQLPVVFRQIFQGAFSPSAVTGGAVGSMLSSLRTGVARGIFSNEAGLGTASMAHASADTDSAVKQGMFGIFEVFVDTFLASTMTAMVILCSGISIAYGEPASGALTISGFSAVYGNWAIVFIAVVMIFFAFTTVVGWGLYGTRCTEFLFGKRALRPFLVIYALVSLPAAMTELGPLWRLAETCNGLMAIPNLLAVLLLSGTVIRLSRAYFKK